MSVKTIRKTVVAYCVIRSGNQIDERMPQIKTATIRTIAIGIHRMKGKY